MDNKIINPRRIPTEGIFIHYDSNDILYSLMYSLSTYNPKEERLYLDKKILTENKKIIYSACGFSGSAQLKRNLTKLIEKGLIEEIDNIYYFPYNENEKYRIIENEMLWYLASTRPTHAIRIYISLLDWFLFKQKTDEYYIFTNKDILKKLGYSIDNKVASSVVSNILESFSREGVIEYEKYYDTAVLDDGKEIPTPKMKLIFVAKSKKQIKRSGTQKN